MKTPLRIHCKLDQSTDIDLLTMRLKEAQPFFIEVESTSFPDPDVLEHWGSLHGPRITWRLPAAVTSSDNIAILADYGITPALLVEEPADIADRLRDYDTDISIVVVPYKNQLSILTDFLKRMEKAEIASLHLPNFNLVESEPEAESVLVPYSHFKATADALADYFEKAEPAFLLKHGRIVIHDYFLRQAIHEVLPDIVPANSAYKGCQAGDLLCYIASDGMVYGCASWPAPLGNINTASLADIWGSTRCRTVVEAAQLSCEQRESCPDESCRGGCRGLTALFNTDSHDPGCPYQ